MTSLWLGLVLLIVAAMAFVLIPLWRHRGEQARSALELRRETNRELFLQRQQELARDAEQGLINAEEQERLLAELQRTFLADMQALERQAGASSSWSGGRPALLLLVLLIPVGSLLIYNNRGAGPDLVLPQQIAAVRNADSEETQLARMNDLAGTLQARFDRHSDDIRNGYMLGTLYMQIERYPEAIAVFQRLLAQMDPNPDKATVFGELAQAQYMAQDSRITPEVQSTIDAALALNPNEPGVMSTLAIDALLREDFATSLQYMRRQMLGTPAGSPQAQALQQRIAMVEGVVRQQGEGQDQGAATGPEISVTITLDPSLAEHISEDMRLFVFVRSTAMPMPILAQNLALPEFPFTIMLNDSMSMAGMTLGSASELVVGARLSRSGTASAQSGDLETLSEPFVLSELEAPIELVIDEVVD